ncbi:MAG: glycosyltransferase family 2 protein [Patescibacteria group bacterium]|nr:glycosyltransferase family 2 protein [Patescibacteria group bacterium]
MIGIITINYNQYQLTQKFLDSLKKIINNQKISVFIADFSSNYKMIKVNYPFPVYVKKEKNKGYAYGINLGLKYFRKQGINKFCILNNDVYFDKNFINEIEKSFLKFDIFGGKIYYAAGYEYHKNRYQKSDLGKIIWYTGGIIDWKNCLIIHRGVDEVDHGQYEKTEETEFITGCLICFNQKVIEKVGFWDERYFLYYEDADFCEKTKRKGFKLIYNPKIIIYHKNAQSTGGSGSTIHQQYQKKSQLLFGLKYAPFKTKIHLIKNYFLHK